MGWLYCEPTKQLLIDRVTSPWKDEDCSVQTIKYCLRIERDQLILWTVNEYTFTKSCDFYGHRQIGDKATLIHCILFGHHPDKIQIWNSWGYMAMSEHVEPYFYSCPISYLRLANAGVNNEWRAKVYQYHQLKFKKAA